MTGTHKGILGVDVGWLESVVPGIEEIAFPEGVFPEPCERCNGAGWVPDPGHVIRTSLQCPRCSGSGREPS